MTVSPRVHNSSIPQLSLRKPVTKTIFALECVFTLYTGTCPFCSIPRAVRLAGAVLVTRRHREPLVTLVEDSRSVDERLRFDVTVGGDRRRLAEYL